MILTQIKTLFDKHFTLFAVASSLLLSLYFAYDSVANTDAYLYFHAAQQLIDTDFVTALHAYHWPLYPALLAALHTATGAKYHIIALTINAFAYAALLLVFAQLLRRLHFSTTVVRFALLLLLVHPQLNGYRDAVLRDNTYWFLFITALYCFVSYAYTLKNSWLYSYFIVIFVAILFRIEALIIWAVLPITLLFFPENNASIALFLRQNAATEHSQQQYKTTLRRLLLFYSPAILLVPLLLLIPFFISIDDSLYNQLRNITDFNMASMLNAFNDKFQEISTPLLNHHHSPLTLFLTGFLTAVQFLLVFIAKTLRSLHPLYAIATLLAMLSIQLEPAVRRLLIYLTAILWLIPCVFFVKHAFVSGRFFMPLLLLSIIWVALLCAQLWQKFHSHKSGKLSRQQGIIVLLTVYLFLDSVITMGTSKQYYRSAGEWLAAHMTATEQLVTNSAETQYYANRLDNLNTQHSSSRELLVNSLQQPSFDYLALEVGREQRQEIQQLISEQPLQLLRTFENNKGDAVLILQRKNLKDS